MMVRLMMIAACVFYCGCSSPVKAPPAAASEPVKILAFYPREATVFEGGSTLLCYGVSNAKSVRIEPPVDGVSPALTRCVEVRPKAETLYTLTASGADGKTVAQSVTVHIGIDAAALPKIIAFRNDGGKKDYAGKIVYTLSFSAQNAQEVSIDPPVFPTLHGTLSGQFSVRPEQTTTYTLSAKGKNGHVAQKSLTLKVP